METGSESITKQTISADYDLQLQKFADNNNKESKPVLPVIGFILCLFAVTLLVYIYRQKCDDDCNTMYFFTFIITGLLITAAITCFVVYRKIVIAPGAFKKERIFLRDITIALQLAKSLPAENKKRKEFIDKDGKLERTEVEEQYPRMRAIEKIIQTLTNRYPN